MPKFFATAFCLIFTIASTPVRAQLELEEGDSVVLIGNTFAERLALSGYFDAMIHAANPDKNIIVRSVPHSGDEVADMRRENKVPPAEFYLQRHGADVIFMAFGMSESFDGPDGIKQFEEDLAKQIDRHVNAKYNGESAPKIVLLSPIAHEDLGAPLPTGTAVKQRNNVLRAYTNAMRRVASEKDAVFVELYASSIDAYEDSDAPLTSNGIAPNEAGCRTFAAIMAEQLGWYDMKLEQGNQEQAAELRQIAYDKHYHFRHRYRATNTQYVWGERHAPFGVVNFPPELDQLDRMVAAREAKMWEMDKPTLAQLFAATPIGKAIWETTPITYDYPEDKWPGVDIPAQNTTRAVGGTTIDSPETYLESFEVLDGFQVNLFASEREFPELANPLAMTFDYKGRLWVLCSPTYPHPFPGEATDCRLIILEDAEGNDGKADKVTVFARHMNIPTGFAIDADGVVYIGQAPDLWKFTDTDGDDVADRREIVYSGFGLGDSHHTISAFTWDPNGGIMMAEGWFGRATIETPYGTQRANDAAVWRYDPRAEKLVAVSHTNHPNPWGHTYDEHGQSLYMDTSGPPIYNLSSLLSPYVFPQKPRKGPAAINRGRPNAGSDIIYSAHWPEEFQGVHVHSQCIGFLGTHMDRLKTDGAKNSGYFSEAMPPILSSKIGNYRPVCSELGQDGALYIADWVNPLIGHMQFNVRDARRDRKHGRIYRVTHKENALIEKIDLTQLDIAELLDVVATHTEQNTRDRARRLLQMKPKDDVVPAVKDWVLKELNPRDDNFERMTLEAVWILQGHGVYDTEMFDEVTRARDPRVIAGAIRAIRYGLQFGDMETRDAKSYISREINNRDMRVRLEAVMACAYLDSPDAVDIANRVTTEEMDGPIRNAHQQTIQYLKSKGYTGGVGALPAIYALPADQLLAELKKKEIDPLLISRVILAREDLALEERRKALEALAGEGSVARGKLLIQTANNSVFDPVRTAKAIEPLLKELPADTVLALSEDLASLLDSTTPEMRSIAVALKVQAGASLDQLAERDPVALLSAITSLKAEQASDALPAALLELARSGKLNAGVAIAQADRLSTDKQGLFEQLAVMADPAMNLSYDPWSTDHTLAMAALAGMHQTPDADWPEGFDAYRIERPDPDFMKLGKEIYLAEERNSCVKCHDKNGEGKGGFPPLAGSPTLLGDPVRAAVIAKYGIKGELPHTVNPIDGKPYNAEMEPLSQFTDLELAAALTYARQHFGNFASPVTLEHMDAARAPRSDKGEGENAWDSAALFAKFPFERDRITGALPAPSVDVQRWKPPAAGMPIMLAIVGLAMFLILAGTYAGKFMQPIKTPAH